jgi:hypothetical protein
MCEAGRGRQAAGEDMAGVIPDDIANDILVKCCGEIVKTPFCPMCGRPSSGHSLVSLLSYCRKHLKATEASYRKMKKDQEQGDDSFSLKRSFNSSKSKLRKWSQWVASLEAVLSDSGTPKEDPERPFDDI